LKYLDYTPEIKEALANGEPVVALESTIIAHGMPYPQNEDTALELEKIIRDAGAIPATVAIIDGRIKIGLGEDDLAFVATTPELPKASRRDFALTLAKGKSAATTVSATMIGANMAGIKIFATGGIGGVHRGAEENFDISADLQELAHTPVAVVSAGAKAILDLPLTLEYLETMGVPVIGYGTDEFPAFYTRNSGLEVPLRLNTPQEIAQMLQTQWDLGFPQGILLANPIPEAYSMNPIDINTVIERAISEAEERDITGKLLTPFLLGRITELTSGNSLFSNIQLVKNNAKLAAEIAVHFAKL
jgi:pseudouridine-5'-phosphate glycosidase